MTKILISVEGQTEEKFINSLLYPHLSQLGIYIIPTIILTKRVLSGCNHKGGYVPYDRAKKEVKKLLGDSSAAKVTTMYDYYALPEDFPGRAAPIGKNCYEKVAYIEQEFKKDVDHERFFPFLQLHEFEGLLFSATSFIAKPFQEIESIGYKELAANLKTIRDLFKTPEEINDNKETCPHKRLKGLIPSYDKVYHGPLIASDIGLDIMRKECPHFNDWLTKLENLAN